MTVPRLRYIAMGAPLAIVTGLAGVWIAKPSSVTSLTVPRGAMVHVRLKQPLRSDQSKPGDQFAAMTTEPVKVDGRIAIPAGTEIYGKVVDAWPSGKMEGPGRLRLTLNSLVVKGMAHELHTTDVARYGSGQEAPRWESALTGNGLASAARRDGGDLRGVSTDAHARAATFLVPGNQNVEMPATTPLKFRLIEPLILPCHR